MAAEISRWLPGYIHKPGKIGVVSNFVDCLKLFNDDPQTEGIIMIGEIGEIGGTAEEEGAAFIKDQGHAGAIISGGKGTAEAKLEALRDAGVLIAETPSDLGSTMAKTMGWVGPLAVRLPEGLLRLQGPFLRWLRRPRSEPIERPTLSPA